jgi:hypothetical protein
MGFCKVAFLMKDKAHLTNKGLSEIKHIIGGMNLRRSEEKD